PSISQQRSAQPAMQSTCCGREAHYHLRFMRRSCVRWRRLRRIRNRGRSKVVESMQRWLNVVRRVGVVWASVTVTPMCPPFRSDVPLSGGCRRGSQRHATRTTQGCPSRVRGLWCIVPCSRLPKDRCHLLLTVRGNRRRNCIWRSIHDILEGRV